MSDLSQFILEKLEKIDDKADDIKSQCAETAVKLAAHEEQLRLMTSKMADYNEKLGEHMARTEIAENRQDIFEQEIGPILSEFREKQAITNYRMKTIAKWSKILGLISVAIGVILGLTKLFYL